MPGSIKAFPGADYYKPQHMPDIDFLLISHDHWDHLDYKTIQELKNRVGKVICGLGTGQHFEYWGWNPEKLSRKTGGKVSILQKVSELPLRRQDIFPEGY